MREYEMRYLVCIATIAITLLSGCTSTMKVDAPLSAQEPERIDPKKSREIFTKYLIKNGMKPDDYALKTEPFGKFTTMIHCESTREMPSFSTLHIMDAKGRVCHASLNNLANAFMIEFPVSLGESEQMDLIEKFVSYQGLGQKIIEKTSDIRDYAKAPLDKDLEATVRAPWKKDQHGAMIRIVYTYQWHGGVVRRYRFRFEQGERFRGVSCLVLGKSLGDALYEE
jgi:hypothetical protein